MTEFILKAGATYQMYKSDNQGKDYDFIHELMLLIHIQWFHS